jgi:hypothetical protein
MTYRERLQNPNWQKKRLVILERDNFSCLQCGDGIKNNVTLQVHHKQYIFGREPWDYDDSNFETLCTPCHRKRHTKPDCATPESLNIFDDYTLVAAFTILSADLKYEVQRLFRDSVSVEHQINFLRSYENVKVEDYLIFYTINNVATPAEYESAAQSDEILNKQLTPYESYHFRSYYDLRIGMIKRVLDAMIAEQLEIMKKADADTQFECLVFSQKVLALRTKFIHCIKEDKKQIFS